MTSYILTFLAGALCAKAITQASQVLRRRAARKRIEPFIRVILAQSFETPPDTRPIDHQYRDRRWNTATNFPMNNESNN